MNENEWRGPSELGMTAIDPKCQILESMAVTGVRFPSPVAVTATTSDS